MFKCDKTIVAICFLSVISTTSAVTAQITTDSLEEVMFTGESLQGIQTQGIKDDFNNQENPNLNLRIESEKEKGTGDELLDALLKQQKVNSSPSYTIEKINTNQGDTSDSAGGTIPLANF